MSLLVEAGFGQGDRVSVGGMKVGVVVSGEEWRLLRSVAASNGVSVAHFLRSVIGAAVADPARAPSARERMGAHAPLALTRVASIAGGVSMGTYFLRTRRYDHFARSSIRRRGVWRAAPSLTTVESRGRKWGNRPVTPPQKKLSLVGRADGSLVLGEHPLFLALVGVEE